MSSRRPPVRTKTMLALAATLAVAATANATLPNWLQHIVGASTMEAALYRSMHLPTVDALYPRPPKEAEAQLATLISSSPDQAELYQLKARTDESALDLPAAEADWKAYAAHAKDPVAAKLQLANFYHRQLRTPEELAALKEVAAAPATPAEALADPAKQRGWQTYGRILQLIHDQGLPPGETAAAYDAFLNRYPDQPAAYAQALQFQLGQANYPAAESLVARYKQHFPQDGSFPIRAQALLEYRRGNVDAAVAVYDRSFQPLWPAELVQSYFSLLTETHRQRAFAADARTRLAAHPDGPEALNALARLFFYDQQQGRLPQAQATLDAFRTAREARNGAWSPQDLYTLATLELSTQNYPEAARYNFALASTPGTLATGEPAQQAGLTALVDILLTAPADAATQPLALGAGNLTLYRDIGTLDQGPGYWNGILSLWLNGTSPASEYSSETAAAQTYFHRSKAAELLGQLDTKFPGAPQRATLHAELIHATAAYGEPATVIAQGKQYLADFPQSSRRTEIAGLIADAYARQKDTASEFALYDSLLAELAAKTNGQPLSAAAAQPATQPGEAVADPSSAVAAPETDTRPAFALGTYTTTRPSNAAADEYAQTLDRYLGRLTAEKQLPTALAVLRKQIDRDPNDPLLYERLANFLQQNNLAGQQEELYKQAVAHFQNPGWYDKLARFYLRQKNKQAFQSLTRQVTDIFTGTELESYFARVKDFEDPAQGGPQLALQLNLYAARRFPHDLVFTRNLLTAYQAKPTTSPVAYESVLRHHWWESDDLRQEFFAYLSRTNKLQAELAQLQAPAQNNPAAVRELAEADLWTSHFESAAPLLSQLADLYPADADLDDRAVSIFRSLAYLDPTPSSTSRAVAIERNLLLAMPDSPDRLATLGDLYAEATSTGGEDLATAGPYWHHIPGLHPGTPAGSLTSATIFWDYYQYNDALTELQQARTRFHQPALFGYEAGAIDENRGDVAAAVKEYVAVAVHPPAQPFFVDSVHAAVGALEKPPSDPADSNLQATAQSLFNASDARARLLKLAARPASAKLVDAATAQALADSPGPIALSLRADVLVAQKRQSELAPLLMQALNRATTTDEAAAIGDLAADQSTLTGDAFLNEVDVNLAPAGQINQQYSPAKGYSLTPVYEAALLRQIALATDPVQKIQLQYTLVTTYEAHKQLPEAQKTAAAIYQANPRILGVVRGTVAFYARNNQPGQAIGTLLAAAKAATPRLAHDFTLEAANRANDSGDSAQARSIAMTLLPASPYDPQVLGVIATSYARAKDDQGLKAFYLAQLDKARTDPGLLPADRKIDIALLRRGLIPALTRLNDFEGAENQYIALISAYPDDAGTAQQAALYALSHKRQDQLAGFLQTTVKASPQDARFAILLAQVDTTFEDLPGALAAYDQAVSVRKDRVDVYQGRADLNLRLGHLDAAADDLNRLYLLSYKDPQYMVRLAELRARQQRPADAVAALKLAYIDGRANAADNNFTVAAQLAQWNLLTEARSFADRGREAAGAEFLATAGSSGPATYANILARQGQASQALTALATARRSANAATATPAGLLAEIARLGLKDDDSADFKKNFAEGRRTVIEQQYAGAITAIGNAVDTYDTPEQKTAYAKALDLLHTTSPDLAITAAAAANLADREALWRRQKLLTGPLAAQADNLTAYTTLEQHRLQFAELAQTLELYAVRATPDDRPALRQQAAQAWHNAGTPEALTNEVRLSRSLAATDTSGTGDQYERYLDVLLHHDPAALAPLAGADATVNYVMAHGSFQQISAVLQARGKVSGKLWTDANTALAGLYLTSPGSPPPAIVTTNFSNILRSNDTIADRILHRVDPAQALTGDLWFPFASRFGIAQLASSPADAEGLLAADLELSPTRPGGYLELARTYADAGNTAAALAEYAHVLELTPSSAVVHDEIAVLQSRSKQPAAALAEWRLALGLLKHTVDRNAYSEDFYTTFAAVLRHLGERQLTATLRPEIEAILRPELAKNGNYRSNELLKAVYQASGSPQAGAAVIVAVSASASTPDQVLEDIETAPWLTPQAQQQVLERRMQLAREALRTAVPGAPNATDPETAAGQLRSMEQKLLDSYMSLGQDAQAEALLATLPAADANAAAFQRDRILLAAHTGRLDALLAGYRATPETAATPDVLNAAANTLANPTGTRPADQAGARTLREFAFDSKQQSNTLASTDFLALAQARIATDDLPGTVQLLNRLSLRTTADPVSPMDASISATVIVTPYANTDSAAALLESTRHFAEAMPFLQTLAQAVPWNATYRLRLAEAQVQTGARAEAVPSLTAIARDSNAPYVARAQAAQDLAPLAPNTELGSVELTLLTNPNPTAPAASQAYFVPARIAAAASAPAAQKATLLREAIATAPNGLPADRTRLALLQATLAGDNPNLPLAILEGLQGSAAQDTSAQDTTPDATPADDPTPAPVVADAEDPNPVNLPAIAATLDPAARVHLAEAIAQAEQRAGETQDALAYLLLAVQIDAQKPQPDAALAARLKNLRLLMRLERLNTVRRPVFAGELTAPTKVRPRLTLAQLRAEETP